VCLFAPVVNPTAGDNLFHLTGQIGEAEGLGQEIQRGIGADTQSVRQYRRRTRGSPHFHPRSGYLILDRFCGRSLLLFGLGMFIVGMAMIFLTVTIFVPLIVGLGLRIEPDLVLIWFGIVLVMMVEISLITPPIGMNVFVISSMLSDVSLKQVFQGIHPFFIADLCRLAIVVAVPSSVLWLVRQAG